MSGVPPKPMKRTDDDDDGPNRRVDSGGAGISFAPMAPVTTLPYDMSSMDVRSRKMAPQSHSSAPGPPADSGHPFVWNLLSVPTLPEFHPLERTAVFCEHTSAEEVASRVSTVLRQRSIEASYNDEKARVRCMTLSGVDFRVRLYRGRGVYSHGIIVEVQRRFGYAIDFHEITTAILNAAQGLPTKPPTTDSNSLPMVSDTEDDDDVPPPPSSGASSLSMISKMFAHNGYDSYYLGLQTLASLTDASRIGEVTARNVSSELLNPGNDVGAKLLDFVQTMEEDVFNLQIMALAIIANAISAVNGQIHHLTREALRPILIRELKKVNETNLLAAQQAARCLEFTWKEDHAVGELQEVLETAKVVGQARHAGLERQAQVTLAKINNSF